MELKTLEKLRKLAKSLGIKGYSKLRKSDLARQITKVQTKAPAAAAQSKPKPASAPQAEHAETRAKSAPRTNAERLAREARPARQAPRRVSDEERAEEAKYAVAPPGRETPHAESGADLGEDIDRLPETNEPVLRLLPQKPGVLHGYWVLAPGTLARQADLKLRLSVLTDNTLAVLEECAVTQDRGTRYFHVDETLRGAEVYLQLGHYDDNHQFVTTIRRGVARIPDLHAAGAADRRWWISEEQFRTMYLRSGGFARGEDFGWSGSSSS